MILRCIILHVSRLHFQKVSSFHSFAIPTYFTSYVTHPFNPQMIDADFSFTLYSTRLPITMSNAPKLELIVTRRLFMNARLVLDDGVLINMQIQWKPVAINVLKTTNDLPPSWWAYLIAIYIGLGIGKIRKLSNMCLMYIYDGTPRKIKFLANCLKMKFCFLGAICINRSMDRRLKIQHKHIEFLISIPTSQDHK